MRRQLGSGSPDKQESPSLESECPEVGTSGHAVPQPHFLWLVGVGEEDSAWAS